MDKLHIIKSILGDQIYEVLTKSIVKMGTSSVVDTQELHASLKIIPKAILAFVIKETKDMEKGGAKTVTLPWDKDCTLLINKNEEDVYSGNIVKGGKIVHTFENAHLPGLSTHLMSFSEAYDESLGEESKKEETKVEASKLDSDRLAALEAKVDMLLMKWMQTSQPQKLEIEVKKSEDAMSTLIKGLGRLKKAGVMPGMPKPPQPGKNVAGAGGIAQTGLKGDKTAASDTNKHPTTQMKQPKGLSAPKPAMTQPKQPKMPTAVKSEKAQSLTLSKTAFNSKCTDCGKHVGTGKCDCFKALSTPELKKNSNESVTLKFKSDWDSDSIAALYKSIASKKK